MAENPKLVVLSEKLRGKIFTLEADEISLGRNDQRDICIKDSSISSYHCDLIRRGNDYVLIDNNSTNGSRVNNVPVTTEQPLKGSDIIQLGNVELLYDCSASAVSAGSRTHTGIELNDHETGLDTIPNIQNLSPFAKADQTSNQKTQRMFMIGLAVLGAILLVAVILLFIKM